MKKYNRTFSMISCFPTLSKGGQDKYVDVGYVFASKKIEIMFGVGQIREFVFP